MTGRGQANGGEPRHCNGRKKHWRRELADRLGVDQGDEALEGELPKIEVGPKGLREVAVPDGRDLYCDQRPGHGTDHPGRGRCKFHGGASARGPAHGNWKHGRRSQAWGEILSGRLRDQFERAVEDPELLSMEQGLALLEARLLNLLEREELGEAEERWGELQEAAQEMMDAVQEGDADGVRAGLVRIRRLSQAGVSEAGTWQEVQGLLEQMRRLSTAEWERMMDMELVLRHDQLAAVMGYTADSFREVVQRHVEDEETRNRLLTDMSERLRQLGDMRQEHLGRRRRLVSEYGSEGEGET